MTFKEKIHAVYQHKGILKSCILSSVLIIILSIFVIPESQGASPSRQAQLLIYLVKSVPSKIDALSLLKQHKETVINILGNYRTTFFVQLPQIPQDWRESEVEINRIKFLLEHADVEEDKKGYGPDKVYVSGEGRLFKVMVPVVLKDSDYKIIDGKVIVRVDKNIKSHIIEKDKGGRIINENKTIEDIPVSASKIVFFVDEAGNIYY